MAAKLIWATPDADQLIGYMARVSNPAAKPEDDASKLIAYLLKHEHWSPFEMVSACVEIETTRDIARQILRHRSFHFQEFSQRYAEVGQAEPSVREARLQDHKNRQNSVGVDDPAIQKEWLWMQTYTWRICYYFYEKALKMGVAKEQARALLPEGLTKTKMYMAGTMRDWLHYLRVRTGNGTQREHQLVAQEILAVLVCACPAIFEAAKQGGFDFSTPVGGQDS